MQDNQKTITFSTKSIAIVFIGIVVLLFLILSQKDTKPENKALNTVTPTITQSQSPTTTPTITSTTSTTPSPTPTKSKISIKIQELIGKPMKSLASTYKVKYTGQENFTYEDDDYKIYFEERYDFPNVNGKIVAKKTGLSGLIDVAVKESGECKADDSVKTQVNSLMKEVGLNPEKRGTLKQGIPGMVSFENFPVKPLITSISCDSDGDFWKVSVWYDDYLAHN